MQVLYISKLFLINRGLTKRGLGGLAARRQLQQRRGLRCPCVQCEQSGRERELEHRLLRNSVLFFWLTYAFCSSAILQGALCGMAFDGPSRGSDTERSVSVNQVFCFSLHRRRLKYRLSAVNGSGSGNWFAQGAWYSGRACHA